MSLGEFQQREADSYSRRRNLMDKEQTAAFDAHYGRQAASGSMSRNNSGAGKGDKRRPTDTLLYDIGWELSFNKDLSDEDRTELRAMQQRLWDFRRASRQHPG